MPNVESFLPSTESTRIGDTFIQDAERRVYTADMHPGGSVYEGPGTADNIGADDVKPKSIQDTAA